MPGDGLPFSVRVGRKKDVVGCRCGFGDLVDMFAVARDGFVLHGKVVVGVDSTGLGDQVAHVAIGSKDLEILAQILFQSLGLGRRLDDKKVGCHMQF